MPQYEYICEEDGEVITLLRPMREADAPVPDPTGKGRRFIRRHSTFAVTESGRTVSLPTGGGGCACGNPHGPCGH
ncbi:MAG: zinc ribbon domain-containing protein [Phycisphaeraceae bacterium]|nr:hypothetical protein [Phycisphaerales bacterium]QOJ17807.1 MAG: zinc ribbon domain-containing protein [Phycisphaeraceae bacterium]